MSIGPNTGIRRLLLALIVVIAPGSAATRTVGHAFTQCPNAQFSKIKDAIDASSPGDVIDVCPAAYDEQLLITKPLTIRGLRTADFGRVLLQPSTLNTLGGLPYQAVITAMNTEGVVIENLVIDASQNKVIDCNTPLAGVHFYNATGSVNNNTITGAQVANPKSCTNLYPGSGFGIRVEGPTPGTYKVSIQHNSIHDFTRTGVLATDDGVYVDIGSNSISGAGPASGTYQFGIYLVIGPVGFIHDNQISMGSCGSVPYEDCVNFLRSEGIAMRVPGEGTIAQHNFISTVQSGIFILGGNKMRIADNVIQNIDALDGITIQGFASGDFTNGIIEGNVISHVSPLNQYCSVDWECCGINEYSLSGVSGNTIRGNMVSDAFCGVSAVAADKVVGGQYFSTLYPVIAADDFEDAFPSPSEPGASAHARLGTQAAPVKRPPDRKSRWPNIDQ